MKEIKKSKIRIRNKDRGLDDTLNITKELQRSLTIDAKRISEEKKKREERKYKTKKAVSIALLSIVVIAIICGVIWSKNIYSVAVDTSKYEKTDSSVEILNSGGKYVLYPKNESAKTGIIIYPNEKTDTKSYLGIARELANDGYKVVIAKYFFNYPAVSNNPAKSIIEENNDISKWYLISHSKSGELALRNSALEKSVRGVVFLGSYPIGDDLKLINKPVSTIWGTQDGVIDFSNFEEYKKNLPEKSYMHEIIGANNTFFSDSKLFKGDNNARISRSKQQEYMLEYVREFIKDTKNIE